jgi:hypothetical protein
MHKYTMTFLAAALLLAWGCGETTTTEEGGAIADALEQENGGLTMEDEAPAFGEPEAFRDLAEYDRVEDELADDPAVDEMRERPDAAQINLIVEWGQIPGNPENETPRNWSGVFHVNRGAMVVRRVIKFEEKTDRLLPRPDRQHVPFTSVTLPHYDGMILTIIDPEPESDEPLVFTYVSPLPRDADPNATDEPVTDATTDDRPERPQTIVRVPVRDLVEGRVELLIDDAGNRMVAAAMARPLDICERGFLGGRWQQVEEGRGRFIGRVMDDDGEPVGHVRGIYGRRENGVQVFFGKFINLEGDFKGIFKGEYGEGHFRGGWLHRSGEHGVLGGAYREGIPGPEAGGHFVGRWAETSCNLDL